MSDFDAHLDNYGDPGPIPDSDPDAPLTIDIDELAGVGLAQIVELIQPVLESLDGADTESVDDMVTALRHMAANDVPVHVNGNAMADLIEEMARQGLVTD